MSNVTVVCPMMVFLVISLLVIYLLALLLFIQQKLKLPCTKSKKHHRKQSWLLSVRVHKPSASCHSQAREPRRQVKHLDEVGKQASYWPATDKGGATQASAPEPELRDSSGKFTMFNNCNNCDNCERFLTVPQTEQVLCAILTPGLQSRTALSPPQAAHGLYSLS